MWRKGKMYIQYISVEGWEMLGKKKRLCMF